MFISRTLAVGLVGMVLVIGSVRQTHAASVAYINADGGTVNYLTEYGHSITYLDDPTGLTLDDLSSYDVIMVASNNVFSEPENIGNVSGDFADSGGGVVLTLFDFVQGYALSGKVMTPAYSPFTISESGGHYLPSVLDTIHEPDNAMLSGIDVTKVDTIFQAEVDLNAGAHLVADWDSGRHAIAYTSLTSSSVVGLNLYPKESRVDDPDTQQLVANAISFSMSSNSVPEPTSLVLWAGLGAMGLIAARRRRRTT